MLFIVLFTLFVLICTISFAPSNLLKKWTKLIYNSLEGTNTYTTRPFYAPIGTKNPRRDFNVLLLNFLPFDYQEEYVNSFFIWLCCMSDLLNIWVICTTCWKSIQVNIINIFEMNLALIASFMNIIMGYLFLIVSALPH